jgi:hypothetical protein
MSLIPSHGLFLNTKKFIEYNIRLKILRIAITLMCNAINSIKYPICMIRREKLILVPHLYVSGKSEFVYLS